MITVSVCMIVKNEEEVLARCLDSLLGIADEIIVVDTGSEDRTKEIAAAYTDKIYDFVWVDDFSAARNYSFSKAGMEYIYVADADEVLAKEEQQKFLRLKETLDPKVEIVQMLYTNQLQYNTTYNFDEELRPKLYRRLRSFVWQEPLHEAVRLAPLILDTDIRVKHMPLSNHAGRDFAGFERAVQRDGGLSDHLAGMYARELMIAGDAGALWRSVPFFEGQCACTADEKLLREAICVLVRAAHLHGDEARFFKYALKNLALGRASSEVLFELGEYYFEKQDFCEAAVWYYNAIYEAGADLNLKMAGSLPAKRLAELYERMGEMETAAQYRDVWKGFLEAAK